jgi:hypothetical protein
MFKDKLRDIKKIQKECIEKTGEIDFKEFYYRTTRMINKELYGKLK